VVAEEGHVMPGFINVRFSLESENPNFRRSSWIPVFEGMTAPGGFNSSLNATTQACILR
jgi:hypothetical protein